MAVPFRYKIRIDRKDMNNQPPHLVKIKSSLDLEKVMKSWIDVYLRMLATEKNPEMLYFSISPVENIQLELFLAV